MASTDSLDTVRKFAKKNNASFPILSDTNKKVAKSYGVLIAGLFASRTTFIIKPDGSIAYIEKQVNPLNAGDQLLRILDRLM
tara:strand:- start:784 stop:1029 length:246 start_codon:yes stop_codon:yes gene_type:complete